MFAHVCGFASDDALPRTGYWLEFSDHRQSLTNFSFKCPVQRFSDIDEHCAVSFAQADGSMLPSSQACKDVTAVYDFSAGCTAECVRGGGLWWVWMLGHWAGRRRDDSLGAVRKRGRKRPTNSERTMFFFYMRGRQPEYAAPHYSSSSPLQHAGKLEADLEQNG